jgi:hypothetical protein
LLTLHTNKLQDEINESYDLRNNIERDASPVNNNDINNDVDNDENNVENLVDSTESSCDKSPQKFNIEYTDNVTREELAAAYLTAFFEGKITQSALTEFLQISNATNDIKLPTRFDGLVNIRTRVSIK